MNGLLQWGSWAGKAELDAIDDITDPSCPVRYIITVQKLREGWDCPFAYVLCSVAELSSPTAVEQLLGPVLAAKRRQKTEFLLAATTQRKVLSRFHGSFGRWKDYGN